MKTSIAIPTTCRESLRLTLSGLASQSAKPDVVLLVHACRKTEVQQLVEDFERSLNIQVVAQEGIGFPGAINTALRRVEGDIVIFTDDDAIPPKFWVRRYVEVLEALGSEYAGVSSRDVLFGPDGTLVRGPDDEPLVRLYRWLVALSFRRPLPVLREYRLGVYVDRRYSVAHGPCIPYSACLSLPYRGVNMAFRREALEGAELPESPAWARGEGNEQYLGLLVVLGGYKYAYIPSNPVLHAAYGGISKRRAGRLGQLLEKSVVSAFFEELLKSYQGNYAEASKAGKV